MADGDDSADGAAGSDGLPSHDTLFEALDTLPEGFVVYDAEERLVLCNRAFRDFNPEIADRIVPGARFADLVAAKVAAARGAGDLAVCDETCGPACSSWAGCRTRVHRTASRGVMFETTADGRWIRIDEHRTPSGYTVGLRTDLTDIRETQRQLERSEAKFRALYALAPVGIVRTALDGRIVDANPTFAVITGSSPDDRRGFAEIFDLRDRAAVAADLARAGAGGEIGPVERRLVGPDGGTVVLWMQGTLVPDAAGEPSLWWIVEDVTEHRRAEEQIRHAAHHDVLTGLPNRKYLGERLAADLAPGTGAGLLLVDLDNFKLVNDTLGHQAGDDLLRTVAERLREAVRDADFVARLGGDEFAVVVADVASIADVTAVAERIVARVGDEIAVSGRSIRVGVSIGMAIAPAHGREADELLRFADTALYEAKRAGRNRWVVFDTPMQTAMRRRFDVVSTTRQALGECRVVPHYQPIVDLASGALDGFEALCRVSGSGWDQLPAAEIFHQSDVGRDVDERMLALVTDDMAAWQARGFAFGRVAINVCDAVLRQCDYDRRVMDHLAAKRLGADRLSIEVTESTLMEATDGDVRSLLQRLREAGTTLALDDFGTGFASLSHLKSLPVDRVKIDRSFVCDLEVDPASRAIVEALVRLGAGLGKEVVAEGIETEGQCRVLVDLGCRLGQGYLFGRAAEAAAVERRWRDATACDRRRVV